MSGMAVRIVDFRPELAEDFRRLNTEWLQEYFEVEPVDRDMLGRPVETILQSGGAIVFAELDGRVVGTAALRHHGGGVYELTKMAVTGRCRGRGIGRALLLACLERYAEAGGRELYLESHSSLAAAIGLYESAGFEHAVAPSPSVYRRANVFMRYVGRKNH